MSERRSLPDDTVLVDETAPRSTVVLSVGVVFAGRYRIEERLGEGGMGVVYRVHDLQLGETVALKIMTLPSEADDRLVDEVRLARRVTHRNVARTHDIGIHQGVRFLTMEYVNGASLEDILDRAGRLTAQRAANLAAQIASALESAHAAGVIHRDLKPANILVAEGDRALITDFGIASAVQLHGSTRVTGDVIGTPLYMSPEQAQGGALDARSDLYSFGVILYEMLTGRLPFEGDDPLAVLRARIDGTPPHPSAHAEVPAALGELVMWLLARDAERRPGSATEVRQTLEGYLEEATASAVQQLVPLAASEHALAVLPFRYRGPGDHDYLGEGLAEELIDTLSRTKGLKVFALGATRRFADERDPMRIGAELGADVVVDGTLQLSGGRVRLTARLLSAGDGVQRWNDRFDVPFGDVMTLQESLGRRVAEALRLEVSVAAYDQQLSAEAAELYLRARHIHRRQLVLDNDAVVDMLRRCLALAPSYPPALAMHAMAAARASWMEQAQHGGALTRAAEAALVEAERAGDLAETHLARGMFLTQQARFGEAVASLLRAVEVAPALPDAQQYLGALQIEGGHAREGIARLELSLELDPELNLSHVMLARAYTLLGDDDEAERHLAIIHGSVEEGTPPVLSLLGRIHMYRGDPEGAQRAFERVLRVADDGSAIRAFMIPLYEYAGGDETKLHQVQSFMAMVRERFSNLRFVSLMGQMALEVLCYRGRYDDALAILSDLADGVLIDTLWLEHCGLFDPVRRHPRFAEAAAKVRHRAGSLWQAPR